jgi:tryptophan synthase beta chain
VAPDIMGDPGPTGRFGRFGGRFVPESLVPACMQLETAFRSAWSDAAFRAELEGLLRDYGGRPTPVTECTRLSEELGVRVLLKREDLPTPAPTSSTTSWAKDCWLAAWERAG